MITKSFPPVLFFFAVLCASPAGADRLPNVIVFYTDDHGHADLGCQGVLDDIRTPHIDALAESGVRAVHGYSTAPQCVPSRGGLLIGKFQSRFGLETNGSSLDGFNAETTIAERLKDAGYATAQFGKWHLGPAPKITDHGFDHVFAQNAQREFHANISLDGTDRPMGMIKPELYHVDGCSRAAASVIRRYQDQPFFLYIAYRAPHVPLDAPKKYLSRFPGEMPERRRQALAMISATDDGVGLITQTLKECDLTEETLLFYIGDNGAPLKIHKLDAPGGGPGWDGSLNDPLNGEKGMLAEGGVHVPFVVSWPGTIPAGQTYEHPVSALDVAATATAQAGLPVSEQDLDGVDLIPFLNGDRNSPPHDFLAWRWGAQAAIREGNWKLLRGGEREYLYDLAEDLEEKHSLLSDHPEVAAKLREKLRWWSDQMNPPGLSVQPMSATWNDYFDFYLEGKPPAPLREKFRPSEATETQGWIARGGKLSVDDAGLRFKQVGDDDGGFIALNGLAITGASSAVITYRASESGNASLSWRTKDQKAFERGSQAAFTVSQIGQLTTAELPLDVKERTVHVRVRFPGDFEIRSLVITDAAGKKHRLWKR